MIQEYEFTGKAMGTNFSISIVCGSEAIATEQADKSIQKIHEYEARFSRFIPESELSKVNKEKRVEVSQEFIDVIEEAYRLFMHTKGIFNPLVQIERFGYTKTFDALGSISQDKESEEKYDIDFTSTIIDQKHSKITLQEGQKLDFGGFLKGYLAEKICKDIKNYSDTIIGVIVNIGGDIHTQGTDINGEKFVFEIYNPITQDTDISIPLQNQSLATSGTYKRSWQRFQQKIHHILDSSGTKNPEGGIISASVIAEDGAQAEAYAKVFLSLSPDKARNLLRDTKIKFVVIHKDGTIIKNIT